jgi:hypothetical protein
MKLLLLLLVLVLVLVLALGGAVQAADIASPHSRRRRSHPTPPPPPPPPEAFPRWVAPQPDPHKPLGGYPKLTQLSKAEVLHGGKEPLPGSDAGPIGSYNHNVCTLPVCFAAQRTTTCDKHD